MKEKEINGIISSIKKDAQDASINLLGFIDVKEVSKHYGKSISIYGMHDIDEFISTHSGVYYSKGSTIGEASENGIVWNNDFEGSINLLKFDLTKFETTPEISNNVVQGPVSTSFFKKDYSIENGQFYMVIEKNDDNTFRVRRTYLSFDMSDVYNGKSKTYNVVSGTKFTYKPEIIDYEW